MVTYEQAIVALKQATQEQLQLMVEGLYEVEFRCEIRGKFTARHDLDVDALEQKAKDRASFHDPDDFELDIKCRACGELVEIGHCCLDVGEDENRDCVDQILMFEGALAS